MNLKINRKRVKMIGGVIAILVIAVLFLFFLSKWEAKYLFVDVSGRNVQHDEHISMNGLTYKLNDQLETILLIGVDKYVSQSRGESYNNNQQADFLMLLIIDRKTETYQVLHLNRDTMTDIPVLGVRGEKAGTISGQLALAHTYGSGRHDSCRNTVEAVSNLLNGIEIDHYVAITMDAVPKINELVGGVTVMVLDDMTSISPELIKGATVTLTGDLALAYVRTRHGLGDSSNLGRMERQKQYISELSKAAFEGTISDENFSMKLLKAVSNYMLSDCTANQLSQRYDLLSVYEDGGYYSIPGEAVVGASYMEYYVNETALQKLLVDLFYLPVEDT